MIDPSTKARLARAAEICRAQGITQAQVARAVGASQSQVSRILGGGGERESRLLEEVCLHLERLVSGVTAEAVRGNEELVDAVRATWDGSAAHARALSTVIRSLSALDRRSPVDPKRGSGR